MTCTVKMLGWISMEELQADKHYLQQLFGGGGVLNNFSYILLSVIIALFFKIDRYI